jgi:biotin synthase
MNKRKAIELIKMPLEELMSAAEEARRKYGPSKPSLCAIINAKSGACGEDCGFCAQAGCHNTKIETYPIKAERIIIDEARVRAEAGAKRIGIVTSGKAAKNREVEVIASAVTKFPQLGVSPCASLGEIDPGFLSLLKASGLTRYHHNLETSERFFPKIVTTHTYGDRIKTIDTVKCAGLEICSGGIFGLGETWEDRVEMALALKELEVDSVPINFLVPIEGTPMAYMPVMGVFEALRVVAVFRVILEKAAITVAAGREKVMGEKCKMIFSAGADGMMVGGYLTIPGADASRDQSLADEVEALWAK